MSKYTLYIVVEGPGHSAQQRSHWSFAILSTNPNIANIHQVLLLDDVRLLHHYDRRDGVPFPVSGSEGAVQLAELDVAQYAAAQQVIAKEAPPRNGRDRCQDWVLNCVIALEAAEVLEPGSSEFVERCVGLGAAEVKVKAGARWLGS